MTNPTSPAAYVRQSIDHDQGIKDQIADCLALAKQEGWPEPVVYSDNDTSASGKKPRPDYVRLLADIASGQRDGLVFTHNTRLHRSPRELEDFITAVGEMPIRTVRAGAYDLTTANGRFMARQFGIMAKYETELLAERLRRRFFQNSQDGKPHGRIAYGWKRVDGRDLIHPPEAVIVAEIVARLLGGESVSGITRDLNERRIPVPNGAAAWTRTSVRQLALRPSNAGLRVHQGKVIGKSTGEPIISEDEHLRLVAHLNDPGRKANKTNVYKHLLTGIAQCGVCDEPVQLLTGWQGRASSYICRSCFGVRRHQEPVDDMVSRLVTARLSRPDARSLFVEDTASSADLSAEAQALRAKLDLAADQYADDDIDARQLHRITARLRGRLDDVEAEIGRSSTHPELIDLATPDIAERWSLIPIERRRAVIKQLVEVRVLPRRTMKQPTVFDPTTISVTWRAADVAPESAQG